MPSPGEKEAKGRVERLRERIAGSPEERDNSISDVDRDVLIEFDKKLVSDRLDSNRCGWKHHANLLRHVFDFAAETNGLALSLEDGEEGKEGKKMLTSWIHANYDNQYTVQAKLSAIRVFAMTVLDGDELPKRFAVIEPAAHVDENPAPLPEEVIEYKEMIEMVKASNLTRDKALISSQWDTGPRPMEEMWSLQSKHVTIHDDYIVITLERNAGKTERRDLLVTVGMPYFKEWLKNHPVWDDPEVPLDRESDTIEDIPPETYIWTQTDQNKLLSYNGFSARFSTAAEKVGMAKESNPQHFRRSSASIMARQPEIGERDLRILYDWSYFSTSPEHYIAAHSQKVLTNVGLARGHEIEHVEPEPEVSPIVCERCGEWTMRGIENCVNCDYCVDTDQETLGKMDREIENPYSDDAGLHEKILSGDVTAADLESVEKVSGDIRSMGEKFFEQLSKLKKRARALEENRNSYAGVGGVGGVIVGHAVDVGHRSAEAWLRAKNKAIEIHPTMTAPSQMSPQRKATFAMTTSGGFAVMLAILYLDGVLQALAAGDAAEWIALIIMLPVWQLMLDRIFPDVEEARAAAEEV